MAVKKLISTVSAAAFNPMNMSNGINSFKSIKFFLCLGIYLLSAGFFMKDPFFDKTGDFYYSQGSILLFTSLVIVTTLHWDVLLFGKPQGANFVLQLVSALPITLFYSRIMGEATSKRMETSLLGDAIKEISELTDKSIGINFTESLSWISDLFANWQYITVLVLILAAFSFRSKKLKISILIVLLSIPFFYQLSNSWNRWYLVGGAIFMLAGLAMQYNNYTQHVYYLNIINKLKRRKEIGENQLRVIMRIMEKIDENDQILENEVIEIVNSECGHDIIAQRDDIRILSSRILQNMMNEFNLISIKLTHNGITASANTKLYNCDNILTYIAVMPRVILILGITVLFLLSPVDIIPDALPLVGVLDDMSLTILSFFMTKNSFEAYREK